MNTHPIFEKNRAILCHFDSYSTALVFARYGDSVLAPLPLPEGASAMPAPDTADEHYSPEAVLDAMIEQYGLNPAQLTLNDSYQEWISGDDGPIRIHLVRFTTIDAPHEAIESFAVFKPISGMRGMAANELNLMRQVFNLIMSGG